jgi:hypothetical protein
MILKELLETVRFVVDAQGHKQAVQLDLETWEALLASLQEQEEEAEEDRLLVESGIMPRLIAKARQAMPSPGWEREIDDL